MPNAEFGFAMALDAVWDMLAYSYISYSYTTSYITLASLNM